MSQLRSTCRAGALLVALLAAGCSGCSERQQAALPATTPRAARTDGIAPAHLHVLMINGGGNPAQNYQSHLLHLQHLVDLLLAAGVPRAQIAVFNADGSDPAADLAVRERQAEPGFWLLDGTRLEAVLRTPLTLVNSTIPDMQPQPATKEGVSAWFEAASRQLTAKDTLLIYVTDHGTKNPKDLTNNDIVLWGKDARLSVNELRALIEKLDPAVRVVALMSQCYSGAFANLIDAHAADGVPTGRVCGYFSSTADRPAYGCYAENLGRNNVGHSFHFIQALAASGSFAEAHRQVLVADGTPDVPLRASDEYLERLLRGAAGKDEDDFTSLVDAQLLEAWQDKGVWEPEIRLLDRIGTAYGTFSPRSLAEIDAQAKLLPDISGQMKNTSRAWQGALGDSNDGNLGRYLAAHPEWGERLDANTLKDIDAAGRHQLAVSLLAGFKPFTRADAPTNQKLRLLRRNERTAAAASYRMEVRLGVVLRMRKILTSIAGRTYVSRRATPQERAAYEALRACEDLSLPPVELPAPLVAAVPAFPPFEQDVQRAQESLPAWMGIQFRETKPEVQKQHGLTPGAATVLVVYPDSPAAAAGLELGDIITGPPGQPFVERGQVRTWIMLSKVGEPKALAALRGDTPLRLTLVPKQFPLKWPELPGPPKVGSVAPPLHVTPYRGTPPTALAGGTAHLLFFWATWCGPCKASLPELLAFEHDRQTPVIAITDEPSDRLDAFFKSVAIEFPKTVAVDELRRNFLAYGVSGTPTFVLIDATGAVRSYTTGYNPERGLGIDGWKWQKPPDTPTPDGKH